MTGVIMGAEPVAHGSARGLLSFPPLSHVTLLPLPGGGSWVASRDTPSAGAAARQSPTFGRLAAMTCLLAAVALVAAVTRELDDFYLCDVMKVSSSSRVK